MYTCHPDIIVTKSPLLRITGDVGGILRTRPRLIDKIQYTANNPSATDVSDHVKPPLSSRINNGPLKMLATPWIKLYRSRNLRSAIYFFLCHVLCKDSIPFQAAFKYLTMYHPGIYEVQWEHNGKKCRHRRFGHEINLLTMSVKWLRVVLMTKNYGIFRGGFLVLPYNKKICRLWFCGIKQHCK